MLSLAINFKSFDMVVVEAVDWSIMLVVHTTIRRRQSTLLSREQSLCYDEVSDQGKNIQFFTHFCLRLQIFFVGLLLAQFATDLPHS